MGQAPKELNPYASVLDFFGAELRLWRERRGLSQDQLGGLVHVSGDLVGRIEKAQRRPPPGLAERCDRVLETGGVLTRLRPLAMIERGEGTVSTDGSDQHADSGIGGGVGADPRGIMETLGTGRTGQPDTQGGPADAEEAEVRRNAFLGVTGAAVVGFLAPPLVCGWSDAERLPDFDLDPVMVGQLRAQTEGLRWLDRKEGSYRHLPVAARHALQVARLRRELRADHPLRSEVADVAADACHLVAYQVFDQGQVGRAMDWYRASAELAASAGQQELYVFAMCGVAFMYTEKPEPEPKVARAILDQLAGLRLSSTAACYVETYRAYSHAADGGLDVARRALDRAERLSDRDGWEEPAPWLGVPDASWVARQHAIILSRFGQGEALALLDELDRGTPAVFRRYRITMTCDRALTHAHTGEVEQAADLLVRALHLNRSTRSMEKHRRVLATRQVLGWAGGSPPVRALDQAIRDLAPPVPA